MPERRIYYGGQAVIEGVMIRGPSSMAVACRKPDGDIIVRSEPLGGVYTGFVRRIPFIRGIVVMWETLALGFRALMYSADVAIGVEEQRASPLQMRLTMFFALAVALLIVFAVPSLVNGPLEDLFGSELVVVTVEGILRLAIVVGYVAAIGLLPDVRRIYAYHGAEHKSIHALENGDRLEPESVQKYPTAHVRCGTSFLLTVGVVSILVFAPLGNPDLWLRVLSRIALIPVIAAIAYEIIRLGGAFESSPITRALMWPNLALQSLTTRQPDDKQVEVAIRALEEVLVTEGAIERAGTAEAEAATKATPPLD